MSDKKKWICLFIGTIMLLFCGLIYGWSLFREPFSKIYRNWTVSQLSLTFTISMTFFCIGGFVSGKLLEKLKPRVILLLSALLLLFGFFGVSIMDPENSKKSIMMLYIFYGIFAGTGVGFSYNCIISTVNKWFQGKTGFASGIMLMGFGFGALIFGGIASKLVEIYGIFSAFRILGIVIFVVVGIGALFMVEPIKYNDNVALEEKQGSCNCKANAGIPPKEMLLKKSFFIFIIWAIIGNSAGLMVVNSAASIAVVYGAPAIMGMLVSVFNGIGRVVIGGMFDKLGRKRTMLTNGIFLTAGGVFLLSGALVKSIILVLIGLLCTGVSYGGNPTITSAFIMKEYGNKYFPLNFSIANFSLIPAALIGPLVSSKLIEKNDGNYDVTFAVIIILALFAIGVWSFLNRLCDNEKSK